MDSASREARRNINNTDSRVQVFYKSLSSCSQCITCFTYPIPSVKSSFYGYLANYMGFSGYYNPFTCEAQVNTTVPRFVQPFTTCHEIGHQMGYAKEERGKFCGFLTAKSSGNPAFRYSEFISICICMRQANYMQRDSTALNPYREELNPAVRRDLGNCKAFHQKYQNPFEPIIHRIYGDI